MKNQIQYIFVFLLFLVSTETFAQFRVGIRGGVQLDNQSFDVSPIQSGFRPNEVTITGDDRKFRLGFHAGFIGDYRFSDYLCLQGGLFFTDKGVQFRKKESMQSGDLDIKQNFRLSYIELPLILVYNIDMGGNAIRLGGGPYAAYAISGNFKQDLHWPGLDEAYDKDQKLGIGSDDGDIFKSFDAGITIEAAFDADVSMISVFYSQGILNVANGDNQARNSTIGLSLAYLLNSNSYGNNPYKKRRR